MMVPLEDLAPGILLKGIRPQSTVMIISVIRHDADSAEIVYKDAMGSLGMQLLYRADSEQLEIMPTTLPWSFTADGAAFRLVSEAYRINLAYLFDPLLAVHTSLIEPLPHQITAVYETMLNKQPLRYLLADEQAPCYASEVVKYERLHYLYTYQTTPEDAFTAINTKKASKTVSFCLGSIPVILPGVYRERFVYPIVSLIDALREQQSLEELTKQPGCYDFVFQREVHALTLNVFALNAEASLLLDLCQKGQTIAALIEGVEQQLEETGLADNILAMLGALQEKQMIGVRDEQ